MQLNLRTPATTACRVLVCAAQLVLAPLATRAEAQAGKVSPTGEYEASLACGSGVAAEKEATHAGLWVWDSSGNQLGSAVVLACEQPVVVGGAGAATVRWFIDVVNKEHIGVKQCESSSKTPIGGGRFPCKASGNISATLTIKPR